MPAPPPSAKTAREALALGEELDRARNLLLVSDKALARAGTRERQLRGQLARTQDRLRALLDLFTDDKIGGGWRRTPYLAAEDLAGYRRCADLLPVPGEGVIPPAPPAPGP